MARGRKGGKEGNTKGARDVGGGTPGPLQRLNAHLINGLRDKAVHFLAVQGNGECGGEGRGCLVSGEPHLANVGAAVKAKNTAHLATQRVRGGRGTCWARQPHLVEGNALADAANVGVHAANVIQVAKDESLPCNMPR